MNPPNSTTIPEEDVEESSEDENIGLQLPPYLAPVRVGVKPPTKTVKFALLTPSLPHGVRIVGDMVR